MLIRSEHFNPPECFLLSAWVSPKEAKKGLKNVLKDPASLSAKLLTVDFTFSIAMFVNVRSAMAQLKKKPPKQPHKKKYKINAPMAHKIIDVERGSVRCVSDGSP